MGIDAYECRPPGRKSPQGQRTARGAHLALLVAALSQCPSGCTPSPKPVRPPLDEIGQLGIIDFSYDDDQVTSFGRAIMTGSLMGPLVLEKFGVVLDSKSVTAVSTAPSIFRVTVGPCECDLFDSAVLVDVDLKAGCPGTSRKVCPAPLRILAIAPGTATLEARSVSDPSLIDQVSITVSDAASVEFVCGYELFSKDKCDRGVSMKVGETAGITLSSFRDAAGNELSYDWRGLTGVVSRIDDPAVASTEEIFSAIDVTGLVKGMTALTVTFARFTRSFSVVVN